MRVNPRMTQVEKRNLGVISEDASMVTDGHRASSANVHGVTRVGASLNGFALRGVTSFQVIDAETPLVLIAERVRIRHAEERTTG
jgi:hypothetical protein